MPDILLAFVCFFCVGIARRLNAENRADSITSHSELLSLPEFLLALTPMGRHVRIAAGELGERQRREGTEERYVNPRLSDAPDPEDWRSFRAKLVSGDFDADKTAAAAQRENRRVAPANEALLKTQNEELWKEYLEGAWAHEIPAPEVGGLICMMSLPSQLIRAMHNNLEDSLVGKMLYDRLTKDIALDSAGSSPSELLEKWSSDPLQRALVYRVAESLATEMGNSLAALAEKDNRIVWDTLPTDMQEFVLLHLAESANWQQVELVTSVNQGGTVEGLILNRPLSFGIEREVAELVLNGARPKDPPQYDDAFVDSFLKAFGKSGAVYVGGDKLQDQPATLIHGFDLPGAAEIAPGTRIFMGGVEAAVSAVLSGERSPLDFRWFLGKKSHDVVKKVQWLSVACARPIALKQCKQLPKPLWHEVLEMCSDDLAEISRREILRRTDLVDFGPSESQSGE